MLSRKETGMKTRFTGLFAVAMAVALLLSACGGGGGGGGAVTSPTPLPTATLSSTVPAPGETGVARGVKPAITLAVSNATSSDGSKLSLLCTSRTISFTSASALSADAKSMTVTLTPQADAILAGDNCTLSGDVSTIGSGGTVKTTISTSFSIYAAPPVKALTLIAGSVNSPGSKNGKLLVASFHKPKAIARDAQGNIYVADGCGEFKWFDAHGLIRKISPAGDVISVAGSASYGGTSQDGVGGQAKFKCITGMTAHPDGNLYVMDGMAQIVQRITPNGEVTTIAGGRDQPGAADGSANMARFGYWPGGIAADPQGNLFVADTINQTIRKIDTLGNVTTYAGQAGVIGDADGLLQNARFKYPTALKFDSSGKLYVGDQKGIRVISNGSVSTTIPLAQIMADICPGSILSPDDIDVSSDGRIAIAYANCRSVGIYQNKQLSVLMGKDWDVNDLDGVPSASRFFFPSGLAFLPNGDLLISDFGTHNIKRYSTSTNLVSLYAGQRYYFDPVDGVGSAAKLSNPSCLYRSASGDIWFSQNAAIVRRVNAAGNLTTILNEDPNAAPIGAGAGACVLKVNEDGSFITAAFTKQELRLYSPTGQILKTLATQIYFPGRLYSAVNASGDIFFANRSGGISKYSGGIVSEFIQPIDRIFCKGCVLLGMAFTKTGDLIAATDNFIVKVTASGSVTKFAGSKSEGGLKDGAIADARFEGIGGLAVDSNDAIYVVQGGGSVIRRIQNGIVDTIAGTPWINETEIGPGPGKIFDPREIAYDAASNSLIIMTGNAILRAQLP